MILKCCTIILPWLKYQFSSKNNICVKKSESIKYMFYFGYYESQLIKLLIVSLPLEDLWTLRKEWIQFIYQTEQIDPMKLQILNLDGKVFFK